MTEPGSKTALVLPGGGARGAYQVGVVKAISELAGGPGNPFPIIVGTSAGAINAAVLASHAKDFPIGVKRLEEFWGTLRCDRVYKTDHWTVSKTMGRMLAAVLLGRFGVHAPRSLLDNSPLVQLLESAMHLHQIQDAIDSGALESICINASAYTSANAVCFFQARASQDEWERSRRRGKRTTISVDHILASAALPFLFPARRIGNQYYGDGGIRMTAPLSPAVHCGADQLLIIGTRDESPIPAPTELPDYPAAGELGGYLLDTIFMDTTQADVSRLNRINQTLEWVPESIRANTGLRKLDCLQIRPSRDLTQVTAEHAHAIPASVRNLLKVIGGWGNDWRMPSYLLFEREYTQYLIDLGYADAHNQADRLMEFLSIEH